MKFRMISLFIALSVIFQCCEAFKIGDIKNITVTEVNVDALDIFERGFTGITRDRQNGICTRLRLSLWYIFKPLPIDHEILILLLTTIEEINSGVINSPEMKSSRDPSNPTEHFSSSQQSPSISLQLGLPNSQLFTHLPSSSESQETRSNKKKEYPNVEHIRVGTAGIEVSAIPCTFGDFIIYLVPARNSVHAVLFIKEEGESLKTLGFIATYIKFDEFSVVPNVIFSEFMKTFNQRPVTNTKTNRIIYPESVDMDINLKEQNRLKNLTVCVRLYEDLRTPYFTFESDYERNKENETYKANMKYEIAEMSFEKRGFCNIINFNIAVFDHKKYIFKVVEDPIENKIYAFRRYEFELFEQVYVYTYRTY